MSCAAGLPPGGREGERGAGLRLADSLEGTFQQRLEVLVAAADVEDEASAVPERGLAELLGQLEAVGELGGTQEGFARARPVTPPSPGVAKGEQELAAHAIVDRPAQVERLEPELVQPGGLLVGE